MEDKTAEGQQASPEDAGIARAVAAPAEHLSNNHTVKEEPAKLKPGKSLMIMVIIVSLLSSAVSIAAYDLFIAQKIVTVNIRKYMEEQRDLYLAGKLSAEEVTQNLDTLIASVKSAPKNKIIILEDVVANSPEKFEPR